MKRTILNRPLATVSGFLTIILYCTFTLVAWILYPDDFSPWTHYLSRLGDFIYSPFGAFFYNLGCILTGVALILFFAGLMIWYDEKPATNEVLLLGQIVGVCAAFALILIGVFSEDQGTPHMTASSTFFLLNFIVMFLINIALMFHRKFIKAVGFYGLTMTLLSLPLEILVGGPLIEWYTVFGSLIYVGLLSYNTMMMDSHS
jgi:hypothetical membrane protein